MRRAIGSGRVIDWAMPSQAIINHAGLSEIRYKNGHAYQKMDRIIYRGILAIIVLGLLYLIARKVYFRKPAR